MANVTKTNAELGRDDLAFFLQELYQKNIISSASARRALNALVSIEKASGIPSRAEALFNHGARPEDRIEPR